MNYRKYTWASNRIKKEDMERLYYLKKKRKKPITMMIAEAVKEYVLRKAKC